MRSRNRPTKPGTMPNQNADVGTLSQSRTCPAGKWTKRISVIAFSFFLAKGLMWLALLGGGYKLLGF